MGRAGWADERGCDRYIRQSLRARVVPGAAESPEWPSPCPQRLGVANSSTGCWGGSGVGQGTSSLPSLGLLGPWPGLCFKPDSCPRAKYPLMCLFWCGLENRLISQLPISVTIGMRFYRESVALWAVLETFSSFFA